MILHIFNCINNQVVIPFIMMLIVLWYRPEPRSVIDVVSASMSWEIVVIADDRLLLLLKNLMSHTPFISFRGRLVHIMVWVWNQE